MPTFSPMGRDCRMVDKRIPGCVKPVMIRVLNCPYLNRIPTMAKPNYAFQKRQRELAKKAKKEAKLREKQASNAPDTPESPDTPVTESPRPVEPNT